MLRFICVKVTHIYCTFIGTFAKLLKATISFMSIRPSVCPHGTTRLPLDGFLLNLISEIFFLRSV
jgi:hypothetical protein